MILKYINGIYNFFRHVSGEKRTINVQVAKGSVMARLMHKPPKLAKIHRTLKTLAESSSITITDSQTWTDEPVPFPPRVLPEPARSTPNQLMIIERSSNPNASGLAKSKEVQAVSVPAPIVPAPIVPAPIVPSSNQPKKEEEGFMSLTFVGCTSPDAVFFRYPELVKEFISLQNALYSHFEAHKESIEEPINFDVGFLCAVNCNGRWYRAEVTDIGNFPEINVVLLDKGFSHSVSATEIRRLPDGLDQQQPAVARVSFYNCRPHSGTRWDPNVTQL